MGCSCGSTKNGQVSGCKNNGACGTGGCNKMNVFDWLSNMDMPSEDKFNILEIRFKNGRKEFYKNSDKLNLTTGDAVVVEVPNGHHVGHVSMQGELVRLQMQKKKVPDDDEIKKIYRLATQKDIEKHEDVKKRELPTLYRTREITRDLKLQMKLSDIEYQADNTKATFYYSADDRVDFRELIKILAGEFKIRVEMRQISLRQEAGRLGGIGVCGRELCCSTWLSDFKNVATSAARYQNLSLNPSKLSGQCGRLKCCLNYELETYMEALEHIPKIEGPLLTEKGDATLQKTDIFRKIMWFGFQAENTWHPVNIERVNEILRMNREGKKPASLDVDQLEEKIPTSTLNSDLDRMDKKFKTKSSKNKKKKRKGPRDNQDQQGGDQNTQQDSAQQGNNQIRQERQGNPNQQRQGGNPNQRQGGGNQNQPRKEGNPNQQRKEGNQNQQRREGNPNQQRKDGNPNNQRQGGNPNQRQGGGNPNQRRGGGNPNQNQNDQNRKDNQNPKPEGEQ